MGLCISDGFLSKSFCVSDFVSEFLYTAYCVSALVYRLRVRELCEDSVMSSVVAET